MIYCGVRYGLGLIIEFVEFSHMIMSLTTVLVPELELGIDISRNADYSPIKAAGISSSIKSVLPGWILTVTSLGLPMERLT